MKQRLPKGIAEIEGKRYCHGCQQHIAHEHFHEYDYRCKQCMKGKRQDRYQREIDVRAERSRIYYLKNKDKYKVWSMERKQRLGQVRGGIIFGPNKGRGGKNYVYTNPTDITKRCLYKDEPSLVMSLRVGSYKLKHIFVEQDMETIKALERAGVFIVCDSLNHNWYNGWMKNFKPVRK